MLDTVIAENIGRSLHKNTGTKCDELCSKISDKLSLIKRFDMNTGVISTIVATLPGQDHFTWLQNDMLLISDGNNFFVSQDKLDSKWAICNY
jgi:hypothetical protein